MRYGDPGVASATSQANGSASSKVRPARERRSHHRHPVNVIHYGQATLGEHAADTEITVRILEHLQAGQELRQKAGGVADGTRSE